MSKATFVKDVSSKFTGEARLYETDDGFVVASSTGMSFGFGAAILTGVVTGVNRVT